MNAACSGMKWCALLPPRLRHMLLNDHRRGNVLTTGNVLYVTGDATMRTCKDCTRPYTQAKLPYRMSVHNAGSQFSNGVRAMQALDCFTTNSCMRNRYKRVKGRNSCMRSRYRDRWNLGSRSMVELGGCDAPPPIPPVLTASGTSYETVKECNGN